MAAIEKRAVYPSYPHSVYRPSKGTSGPSEEGLANVSSWLWITEEAYSKWIDDLISHTSHAYLTNSFPKHPSGYSEPQHLGTNLGFKDAENYLLTSAQEA